MKNQTEITAAKMVARERYAWPGGYPLFLAMADGGALCPDCVRAEFPLIVRATRDADRSGWRAAGSGINWEDPGLYCDHCGDRIPSAYAGDDESVQS